MNNLRISTLKEDGVHKRMKNIIKGRDDAQDPASQVRIYDLAREKSFTWPRFSASSRCNAVLPIKVLGEGAFGTVFHASVVTNERQVVSGALKLAKGIAGKGMLMNELKVRAALRHAPHMPQVLAWAADDVGVGVEGILYEAYPGTLQQHIEDRRKRISDDGLPAPSAGDPLFPHAVTQRIVRDLLELLSHAHGIGIFHTDFKPSNILVSSNGSVAVSDWGLSPIRSGVASIDVIEGPYGTDRYMPHELRKCERVPLNATLDTFPLAMIVVELILGLPPRKVRKLNNAGRLARRLPRDLAGLITGALSADRAARPSLRDWIAIWPAGAGACVPEPLLAAPPAARAGSSSGSETVTDSDAEADTRADSADPPSEEVCCNWDAEGPCDASECAAESNEAWLCQPCGASDGNLRRTRSAGCGPSSFNSEVMEPLSDSFVSEPTSGRTGLECAGEAGAADCAPRRTRSAGCGPSSFNSEEMEPLSDSFMSEPDSDRSLSECIQEAGAAACAPLRTLRTRSACSPALLPSTPATSAAGSHAASAAAPGSASPTPSLPEHNASALCCAAPSQGETPAPVDVTPPVQLHAPQRSAPPVATASKPLAPPPPLMWQPPSSNRTVSDRVSLLQSMDTAETPRFDTGSDVSSALTASPCRRHTTFNALYMPPGPLSPDESPRLMLAPDPRCYAAFMPGEVAPSPVSADGPADAGPEGGACPAAELSGSSVEVAEVVLEQADGHRVSRVEEAEEEAVEGDLWRTATPASLSEAVVTPAAASLGRAPPQPQGRRRRRVLALFASCFSRAACRVEE